MGHRSFQHGLTEIAAIFHPYFIYISAREVIVFDEDAMAMTLIQTSLLVGHMTTFDTPTLGHVICGLVNKIKGYLLESPLSRGYD